MTSGAIQYGVPTNEVRLDDVAVNCPATPKSHNCTFPSAVNRMFAAIEKNKDWIRIHFEKKYVRTCVRVCVQTGKQDVDKKPYLLCLYELFYTCEDNLMH